MKLVDNAGQAWRWLSVQLSVIGAAVQATVMVFPDIKNWLSDEWVHGAGVLMFVGILMGRLVDQSKPAGG